MKKWHVFAGVKYILIIISDQNFISSLNYIGIKEGPLLLLDIINLVVKTNSNF